MGFLRFVFLLLVFSFVSISKPSIVNAQDTLANSIEPVALSKSETRIRDAAVIVRDPLTGGYGSGTYFEVERKGVVITASHVVGERLHVSVVGLVNETVIGRVIYIDPVHDFAVVTVPKMRTRSPMSLRPSTTLLQNTVGTDVTYTGYPAGHSLLTVRGRVAGIEIISQSIIMHSYAWMGASGSGVFTIDGKFIGVLYAVDVGRFEGRQIVEDIVWVTPISVIDLDTVKLAIRAHGL